MQITARHEKELYKTDWRCDIDLKISCELKYPLVYDTSNYQIYLHDIFASNIAIYLLFYLFIYNKWHRLNRWASIYKTLFGNAAIRCRQKTGRSLHRKKTQLFAVKGQLTPNFNVVTIHSTTLVQYVSKCFVTQNFIFKKENYYKIPRTNGYHQQTEVG